MWEPTTAAVSSLLNLNVARTLSISFMVWRFFFPCPCLVERGNWEQCLRAHFTGEILRKQQREVMKMAMIRGGGRPGSDGGLILFLS